MLGAAFALVPGRVRASGLIWPTNQLMPTFSGPAAVLDCIDVSSATSGEIDLFASVEGIINRTQPQVVCVSGTDGEGKLTWVNLHNLAYNITNGYGVIMKYRTNFTGLVVTDTNQPHTLNLATTIAGVNNELICDPSLLYTLTNAPYNLPVLDDLRNRFADKYATYGYLYTNYWPQCTHRLMSGMGTNLDGNLRDYLVATKCAVVWLDPSVSADATLMAKFMADMTPNHGLYIGWWPNESPDLNWIASYGIPVLASDWFRNGSVFSGCLKTINVPDIPPPPPLENKVYVALILSDGDNIQYMQHVMKMDWGNSARGSIPISWTVSPLAADLDPVMMYHYWNTVTPNDCLVCGPSGVSYTHMQRWSGANLVGFANLSDSYLQRNGLRVITVWESVNSGLAQAYATNCPTLLGLTDQNGTYNAVDKGLRTIGLTPTYASTIAQITNALNTASATWTGTAPMFLGAQAVVWSLGPADMQTIVNSVDTNKYRFVRADHLFMLANRAFGAPTAVTQPALAITATSATIRGAVTGNATNTTAWLEWGTNSNYGTKTANTSLGAGAGAASAMITGLKAQQIYHYRVVASNTLGMVRGADQQFTTGNRIQTWGGNGSGERSVPPGLTNIVGVAGGASHGLGLKNDGTVVAWGSNSYGQTNVPAGLSNAVAVSGGLQHSLALLSNGTVMAWGDNSFGQTNVPTGLSNVISIAAGGYHSVALKSDQTLVAWGYNTSGQTNIPVWLTNVASIAAGYAHNVALRSDGTAVAWGYNSNGQTNVPPGLANVVAVAAGQYHSVALKADALTPLNLNPAMRLVADSLAGSDGTAISNWTDSVAGKAANQTNTANRPLVYSNVLNGHKTLRFSSAASQFMTVSASDSPLSGATDFTISVVMQSSTPGSVSGSFYLNTGLIGGEQPNAVPDWALCLNGSQLGAGLGAGDAACSGDVSLYGGTVTDGRPHIVTYLRSGSTIYLYVDGAMVGKQISLCTAARGNYDFQIGALTTTLYPYNGDIAEIQIYNRALKLWELTSANQVLASMYGLSGIAGSAMNRWVADRLNGSDGTIVSNWTDSIAGKIATQPLAGNRPRLYNNVINGHKTVRFASASSQYLTINQADCPMSGAGSFTLIMVFKTSTPGSSSPNFYQNTGLLGCEQPNAVQDWAFCINGTQLGAGLGAGASGCGADYALYGGNVTDGTPHAAMYVRNGDAISLYVDGALVAYQAGLCPLARTNYNVQIGAMTTSSYFFNGDIAEIQIYNRALNSWEITSVNEALAANYGLGGSAGSVVAWGYNANGQTNVLKGLTNVLAIASGTAFNLAMKNDGTVRGWGNNIQGQLNVPLGLTNVAAVAAGTTYSMAIGNLPPVAGTTNAAGFIDHDLLFVLPVSNPDGNPLTYRVMTLPSAGALYQYSAGVRGAVINAPNSTVTDPAGQVIFAPDPATTGTPYANFTFTADDALFNAGNGQATINIAYPAAPTFTNAVWNAASGTNGFDLSFSGDASATYSVWSSTNLVDWLKLGPATENQPGQYEYLDADATNWPQRFYKVAAGR
jgi:hypothetical protein